MVEPGSELAIDVRGEAVSFLVGMPADEIGSTSSSGEEHRRQYHSKTSRQ
jgi:hypothetical protein